MLIWLWTIDLTQKQAPRECKWVDMKSNSVVMWVACQQIEKFASTNVDLALNHIPNSETSSKRMQMSRQEIRESYTWQKPENWSVSKYLNLTPNLARSFLFNITLSKDCSSMLGLSSPPLHQCRYMAIVRLFERVYWYPQLGLLDSATGPLNLSHEIWKSMFFANWLNGLRNHMMSASVKTKLYPSSRILVNRFILLHIIFRKSLLMNCLLPAKSTPSVIKMKQWWCNCLHRSYEIWSSATITRWFRSGFVPSPRWKLSRKTSIIVLLAAHAWFKVVMITVLSGVAAFSSISSNPSPDSGTSISSSSSFSCWIVCTNPTFNC